MRRQGYQAYYRQKMHGGRNTLARSFDYVALRFAIFAGSYVWILFQAGNQLLALALAVVIVLMFSVAAAMLERLRLEKFMEKYRTALRKRILLEQIVLSDTTPYVDMLAAYLKKCGMTILERKGGVIFAQQKERNVMACLLARLPSSPVEPQELLQLTRYARSRKAALMAFSSSGFSDEAHALLDRLPKECKVRLFSSDRLLALAEDAELLPGDDAIDKAVEAEMQREQARFTRFRSSAIMPGKTKRYLICAAVIFAASFVTGYQIYYFILAGLCLCLAGVTWWVGRHTLPEQDTSQSL